MFAKLTLSDRGRLAGRLLPGIVLSVVIAGMALLLTQLPIVAVLSPLAISVLLGIIIGNTWWLPSQVQPGIAFAGRNVLRCAIVLLGFQLSLSQILAVGLDSLVVVILAVSVSFIGTLRMASWLGVDRKLAQLIAAGTSICGASAVIAMNSLSEAPEEDVIYAVGSVTIFGTILMFALPVAGHLVGLDSRQFGIWAGSSIHEIAQVTGSGFQFNNAAGEAGVVVKLTRVLMLAPLILCCGLILRHAPRQSKDAALVQPVPLFVVGFVGAVALNSILQISPAIRAEMMVATVFLMATSLAALGVQTHFGKLRARGMRPLALGALASILIVAVAFALIQVFRLLSQ